MYDLLIIGGGPAGLTAAIYAIRKRLNVMVISKDLGGKTNYRLCLPWIEDYQVIRGLEVVDKFRRELEYLDFANLLEPVTEIKRNDEGFQVNTKNQTIEGKALIIATGARQQFLNIPGEREFMMQGLCYSALSYAPLFIDRTAVVVGDGDLALRSAAELAVSASKVFLVWPGERMPMLPLAKKLREAENVNVLEDHRVERVEGDEFARRIILDAPDGNQKTIETDGIFIEKALIPNSDLVVSLVDLDAQKRIKVDCSNRTSEADIFAAGDVTTGHAEQVLIAVGEGAKAALSAYDYLLPRL